MNVGDAPSDHMAGGRSCHDPFSCPSRHVGRRPPIGLGGGNGDPQSGWGVATETLNRVGGWQRIYSQIVTIAVIGRGGPLLDCPPQTRRTTAENSFLMELRLLRSCVIARWLSLLLDTPFGSSSLFFTVLCLDHAGCGSFQFASCDVSHPQFRLVRPAFRRVLFVAIF